MSDDGTQLNLFYDVNLPMREVTYPEYDREQPLTVPDRFLAFHRANPFVYAYMEKLARGLFDEGLGQVSIQYLVTSFRIDGLRTLGTEYKFPNNLSPYYARLLRAFNKRFIVNDFIAVRALKRQSDRDRWDEIEVELLAERQAKRDALIEVLPL